MNAPTGTLEEAPAKGRILVVDDAATIRRYHRSILEEVGYATEEAFNGIEALEIALRMPFDLAVVDVNMPEMDGYSFVSEMRKSPELKTMPAIMVSTEAAGRDAAKAFMAGASYYIVKPAQPIALRTCINLLLPGEAA